MPSDANPLSLRAVLTAVGRFFFRYRDYISPAAFIALVILFPPRRPFGDPRWSWATSAIGIVLVFAGQALRAATIGFAYIKRGGRDKKVYADTLVQEGLFAHSRNPLYVGNFLCYVGFFIIHNSPWCYLIGIPFYGFLYLTIVMAEEEFLERKFGEQYRDYCRRVNRFIPSWRGLSKSLEGMTFNWARLVRKDYGTTYTAISCVLGLLCWNEYYFGNRSVNSLFWRYGVWWVAACVLYVIARVAKKRGWLGSG